MNLLKVGSVQRRQLALMSQHLVATGAYTRSFCEFLVNKFSSVTEINCNFMLCKLVQL